LVEKYKGKVNVVFKNIPLPNHNMARPAAQAALAAHAQGKFWKYHDKIFASYNQLSEQKLLGFAKDLQLDVAKFNQDRTGSQVQNQINQDLRLGQTVGVRGTPTIFINGILLEVRSVQGFSQIIDRELKRLAR
jgi:protein-disulfide isomerase